MNIDINFLRKYLVQNPAKYKQKYGDVLPEEVDLERINSANYVPPVVEPVKIEFAEKTEVEMELKEPEPIVDPIGGQVAEAVVEDKPKKTRKAK